MYERLAAHLYQRRLLRPARLREPVRLRARRAVLRGGDLHADRHRQPGRRTARPRRRRDRRGARRLPDRAPARRPARRHRGCRAGRAVPGHAVLHRPAVGRAARHAHGPRRRARVPVGGRSGPAALGVGAARRAARADRVPAARVRRAHRAARARRAGGRRTPVVAGARRGRRRPAGTRVRGGRSRRGRSTRRTELGRFVPVSTGGGKALFIGTYLPGDGLHDGVKQHLLHRSAAAIRSPSGSCARSR